MDSLSEIIELATGELALAVWFTEGDVEHPEVAVLVEVEREVEARAILQRVTAALEVPLAERGPRGITTLGDEDEAAYAIRAGYVVLGTFAGVRAVVADDRPRLAQHVHYVRAMAGLDSPLASFIYVNLGAILDMAAADLPDELAGLEDGLQSLVLNAVRTGRANQLQGVVAVAE